MTNNSHVLVTAIDSLITCFTALKLKHATQHGERDSTTSSDSGVVLKPLQVEKKKFVECAAYNLLHMRSLEHTKEFKMYPVRSMFAILEQFVVESKLDRSILDRIVAHNLLHSAFVEMSIGKRRGQDDSRKAAEAFLDVEEDVMGADGAVKKVRRKSTARRKSMKAS